MDTIHGIEDVWQFVLNCTSDNVPLIEWVVYTRNNPDYYLKRTIELDIIHGWDGKGKFPVRQFWISDVTKTDYVPNDCEIDDIDKNL